LHGFRNARFVGHINLIEIVILVHLKPFFYQAYTSNLKIAA